jgi:branched-chain amino acid transport system substrate-binding protein
LQIQRPIRRVASQGENIPLLQANKGNPNLDLGSLLRELDQERAMNNFRGFRLLPLGVFMLSTSLLLPAALINHSDAAEASIVLGYQGPLTGPEAQIGIDQLNGVQYAVDVFNKKFEGKIKVTLKTIDDQGDPTVAGPVAQATARDSNLLGIVGPAYSGATIASLPFYKPAGIPLISPSASRITLTDPSQASSGFPIFHRLALTDKTQGPALYKAATAGVTNAKTFIVNDGDPYAVSLLQYMKDAGAIFVGQDTVASNATDWSPVVAKVKASGANVVIYLGYSPQASVFFKQIRDSGFAGILAAPDGALTSELVTQNSASVINGVRITSSTVPVGYISPRLDLEFRSKFGRTAGTYSLESLDAANIMLYCVAKGARSRSQMSNCIDAYSGLSLSGRVLSFDAQGELRNPEWYEFWAQKDAIGTFPFNLMSKVNRYADLTATHDAFPWSSISVSPQEPILYWSCKTGNCEIYSISEDGLTEKNLTRNVYSDREPSWSPDGKQVAFVSERDQTTQIYVMNADGSNQTRITSSNTEKWGPSWSPDGKEIAFSTRKNNIFQVTSINLSSKTERDITKNLAPSTSWEPEGYPKWSPDGSKIVFWQHDNGDKGKPSEIYVINADGSNLKQLTNYSAVSYFPSWSPDGSKLSFTVNGFGTISLYTMNSDGSNKLRVPQDDVRKFRSSWSSDGKKIIYDGESGAPYGNNLYIYNLENNTIKKITNISGSSGANGPNWFNDLSNVVLVAPTPTPTPTPSSSISNACSAANSIGTASLTRVSDLVVQVDAVVTACSYEIVVVSDTGETYRTGIININRIGQISVKEQFINAKCDTGYSFYTNAWTEQNGNGTINRTPSNRMLSATCAPSSVVKPSTPTFSSVNFSGNTININVNIGSSASSRPDKVYLVAPKLGVNSSTPLEGKISGSTASWSLPLTNILSGVSIPLEIVGEKNGVASEPLIGSYTKPAASITAVPPAPTNYSSRIVGTSAIITIQVSEKESSRASSAHLYSSALGIKKNPGLQGDVVGTKALIEVPIKASMAGKKYPLTIYLKNSKGESKPLNATLTIPKAPKAPTLPTTQPKPTVPKAVICSFGSQTRTFEDDCPPGWEKR